MTKVEGWQRVSPVDAPNVAAPRYTGTYIGADVGQTMGGGGDVSIAGALGRYTLVRHHEVNL